MRHLDPALRERVLTVKRKEPELTNAALSERFGVGRDQLNRWLREAGLTPANDRIELSRSMHAGELRRAIAKHRRRR